MNDNLEQLSDSDLSEVFALEVANWQDQYFVIKRGLYYMPKACGYTSNINEAGRYSEEEARKHEYPHGSEPVTIRKAAHPDFANDFTAVLPWLERVTFKIEFCPNCPMRYLIRTCGRGAFIDGLHFGKSKDNFTYGETFSRSACIALIREKRTKKGVL